ncbi:MAG: TPM domain-containing protein, partial [Acidimicrobiia bacterium]
MIEPARTFGGSAGRAEYFCRMHRTTRISLLVAALSIAVLGASPVMAQTSTTAATQPVDCGEYQGVVCQGWFTDEAGVVDDDARVEDAIGRLVARYGNQIAMVVVNDSRGASPNEFAAEIGNAWGVGTEANDGIVVLVDLDERFTAVSPGSGVANLPDPDAIAGAGDSFFASGDFEGGMIAIAGSLEQALAELHGDTGEPPVITDPEPVPERSGGRGWLVVLGVIALVGVGGVAASAWSKRRNRHDQIRVTRRNLVDDDLAKLEPAGQELPRVEDYDIDPAPAGTDVDTAAAIGVLEAIDAGRDVSDEAATRAVWVSGLIAVVDRERLEAESEVPLELRAAEEREILEGAVQQAAEDAIAVGPGDDAEFEVRRQEVQRLVASLRPHRVAAARRRFATTLVNTMVSTPVGEALLTDPGVRFLRSAAALDHGAATKESAAELTALYQAAETKTDRLATLYGRLPESTTRPAVAAALSDLDDDLDSVTARYEAARATLEKRGTALEADGLAIPAVAALLLMNNDDDDIDEFLAIYSDHRGRGRAPDQAMEYALAGLRTPREADHIREEAEQLGLPVSITAALLRRRDDGPEVYQALLDELAAQEVDDESRRTIAGILAISMEPSQAMRRWLEARDALRALG